MKPRSAVRLNVVRVSKKLYNVMRSIVDSSVGSIRCYEFELDSRFEWWCEKETASGIRYTIGPGEVQVSGQSIPGVMITIRGSPDYIFVAKLSLRFALAAEVNGIEFRYEDIDKTAFIPDPTVPFARPILLKEIVEKIDKIIVWA